MQLIEQVSCSDSIFHEQERPLDTTSFLDHATENTHGMALLSTPV